METTYKTTQIKAYPIQYDALARVFKELQPKWNGTRSHLEKLTDTEIGLFIPASEIGKLSQYLEIQHYKTR